MPALSSTMTEGKIVQWLKNEGESVERGESVAVVESDKADMDVESFHSGTVASILADQDTVAPVGDIIGFLAESADDLPIAKERAESLRTDGSASSSTSDPPPAEPFSDGQPQPASEPTPSVPPGPLPEPSPASSTATSQPQLAPGPQTAPQPQPQAEAQAAQGPMRSDGKVIATPYAKKRAKELHVDLQHVVGTGLAGRITASDVEAAGSGVPSTMPAAALGQQPTQPSQPTQPPQAQKSQQPDSQQPARAAADAAGPELSGQTVPLSSMQSMVAKNMEATVNVPVSRLAMSIYTEELDALYTQIKDKGVSMTALLAKAAGHALAEIPLLSAKLVNDGTAVQYPEEINVACAVALEDGLVTPVLRDVTRTDVYSMGRQWKDLVKRARSNSLSNSEMSTGVFTITNLGMYGVEQFDAILPPGQAAILAVGATKPLVEADERGFIGTRTKMTVNLTADHRFVNGDKAAEFLQALKRIVESSTRELVVL